MIPPVITQSCSGGSRGGGGGGGKGGASVPPFGLHLTLNSTDDELIKMEPPFLAIELRKLLLWLTLECFRRKFVRKRIDWTGRAGSLSQKRSKMGVVLPQSGCGFSKFARARVYYNPPFRNPGSATAMGVVKLKSGDFRDDKDHFAPCACTRPL